jgi:dihydroorotate dehydrogenase (NAD+) catalytic subunit
LYESSPASSRPSQLSPTRFGNLKLEQKLFGVTFQNPVLLASGTCGYGEEMQGFLNLDALGGLVIKAVTVEERHGNASPRVIEFEAGMLNSIGLANVGVAAVKGEKLPWLTKQLSRAHVLVNVAGKTVQEFADLIRELDDLTGFLGYELNVSCPNVKEGGTYFSSRADLLADAVRSARAATKRPLVVKLAPNVPDIGGMAEVAVNEGADGLTLINTFPGLLFDLKTRKARLGAGTGGVSGPAILPMGVHAVYQASQRVKVPLIGVGGIRTADDALQYFLAGASLIQIGTASFADPRAAQRVLSELQDRVAALGVSHLSELIGTGRLS